MSVATKSRLLEEAGFEENEIWCDGNALTSVAATGICHTCMGELIEGEVE